MRLGIWDRMKTYSFLLFYSLVCFILFLKFIYLFFGYVLWHAGSQFSDQGLNLCPLQWQLGVLQ